MSIALAYFALNPEGELRGFLLCVNKVLPGVLGLNAALKVGFIWIVRV